MMEVIVETKTVNHDRSKSLTWALVQVFLGSLFLVACSQIKIPLYPVPMTLQTLGIFSLALMQGGRKAFASTLLYLGFACLGLPVLSGGAAESLWWTLPTAGYLVAFPIAAYTIGTFAHLKKSPSLLYLMGCIFAGQCLIYSLGVFGLLRLVSFQEAIMVGVVPFLPLAGVKLIMATSLGGAWLKWKQQRT